MINDNFFIIPDNIRKKYRDSFKSKKERNIFNFLKLYLKWLESDNESFNRTILCTNPLRMKDNKRYNKEFDLAIIQFLYQTIDKEFKSRKVSKAYKGEAYAYLGVGYEYGVFTLDKNPTKAFESYEISAQLSNAIGTFRLAQCFEKGLGVCVSSEKALSFYRCAAKLGLCEALHLFGLATCQGYVGAVRDENTGYYYLKMAVKKADRLCPYPLYDMGLFYSKGENDCGISEDQKFAIENFEKGAELGDPNCKFRLGQLYEFGDLLCKKNREMAVQYYLEAANAGQIEAQYIISEYYLTGRTNKIEKSYEKSFKWALAGATKGHANCAFKCGESALTGTGTNKNILDALFWFKVAKSYGHADADSKINELEYKIAKMDGGAEVPNTCCYCLFGL